VIVVAKLHARQCNHRRSPARQLLLPSQYGRSPQIAETAIPFILLKQNNESRQEIWIIFDSNFALKELWSHNPFLYSAHQTPIYDVSKGFSCSACGFSALHILQLTLNPLTWKIWCALNNACR